MARRLLIAVSALGYDVAMFDGPYQEWTAAKLPVVTGKGKSAP